MLNVLVVLGDQIARRSITCILKVSSDRIDTGTPLDECR
jgi:hypothetical protein